MQAQAATRPGRRPGAWPLFTLLPLMLWLGACQRDAAEVPERVTGGATPTEAVSGLTAHLRSGDLAAFAHDAVPPALAQPLDQAWREGRSRWPLTELPLSGQVPAVLAALSAPQAERTLLQAFNRQFAGADRELRSAAIALGVFAAQYLEHDGAFSADERAHYTQLVAAVSDWAAQAPLSDRDRARAAIGALVEAARRGGVGDDARLGQAGMAGGLDALSPLFTATKQQLREYGLDLDMAFDSLDVSLIEQTGDTARVRMRYLLAGRSMPWSPSSASRDAGTSRISSAMRARQPRRPRATVRPVPPEQARAPTARRPALGIMPPMPDQPSLQFPGGQDPRPAADTGRDAGAPGPVDTDSAAETDAATAPAPDTTPAFAAPLPVPLAARPRTPRVPWWAGLLGRLMRPWIGLKVEPQAPEALVDHRPVCYVLEDYGLSNALILERACREAGLPSPLQPLPGDPLGRKRAYVALSRRNAGGALALAAGMAPSKSTHSESLSRLLEAHRLDPALDVQVVPVSIFVGRSPDKNNGWFSVLFSENWAIVGRFRRLLSILLNGRDTLVRFAEPVEVRPLLAEDLGAERTVRKLSRVLRTHFNRVREAIIGPDLSTRRLLVDKVLASPSVKDAIADQARRDNIKPEDAWKKAHAYAYEIAADYSHPVVRSASFLLTTVWNRIFRGVLVHHLDRFKEAAPGHEIVYVPSHRSHMDYLLLSYLLYGRGIVPPHIFAGVNLNLPVIGTLLRKGGAFFARRSFRGNALYSAVFSEYMAQLVGGGYSIEYFIEGGRSRTGRLLPPKGGALVMTLRAYLREPRKPVLFQPVYIGYEKLMEGNSYLDELSGKQKKKESIWQLLWSIPQVLRSNYGQVVVNFGEPIHLSDVLAEMAPDWDGGPVAEDEKPAWLANTVDVLAQRIHVNINRAADVNPINLLAMALLSTPKHAMGEADLLAQIALSKQMLVEVPYSDRVTVTPHSPAEIVAHGEEIGVLERVAHPLGDVLRVDDEQAVLLTYYRNNVLHLYTASAWIACCFLHNRRMSRHTVRRLGRTMYPFLQAELFLPWNEDGFAERIERTFDVFVREGLLELANADDGEVFARNAGQTDEVFRLRALSHPLQQAFERYYIAISVLAKNGPGTLGAGELESLCQLAAQRLSLLYAPAAPEFFDKSLFRGFIQKLRELGLVKLDGNSKLVFDERLAVLAKDAKVILGRELRHSIEKVSPEAVRAVPAPPPPAD